MERTNSAFRRLSRAVFSVLIVCAMIAGVRCMVAMADDPLHITQSDCKINVHYDGGTTPTSILIMEYAGTSAEVILPGSVLVDGNLYTTGANQEIIVSETTFENKKSVITKVAVSNGIGLIGQAFQNCQNLEEVAVGDSVTYISQNAFINCPKLKTYRIKGNDSLDVSSSGIGQDENGNIYPGVKVYTPKDGPIAKQIEAINAKSTNGNTIEIVDDADPFSHHTVKPAPGSYDGSTPSTGGNGGTTTPSTGGNGGTTTPSSGGNGGTTPSSGGNGGTTTPSTGGNSGTGTPSAGTTTPASGGNTGTPAAGATATTDRTKVNGQDGTPLGKGAAAEAAEAYLKGYASENDPKGTSFGLLQMKSSGVKANSFKLSWKKQTGAKSYVLYGNKCGKKNKYVKQMVTKKTSATIKKVNKKKLSKGTYYKFIVVALDAKGNVLATSKTVHTATAGGKAGNDKSVKTKAKKNKASVKVKKTFKLGAKEVPASKKLKVTRHRKIAYESSNPKIAKVNSKGVITGVKKGSCYVYAYAQNGVCAKIKVTVKK